MAYLFGVLRVAASMLAVAAGYMGWPIWVLALAIPLHTIGSYYFSKSLYDEMVQRLDREGASDQQEAWSAYYRTFWLRELALAFVKLGIGYLAGWWLGTVFTIPAPATTPA